MKKKVVILISLALTLFQGLSAESVASDGIIDLTTERFTAKVGQEVSRIITLTYVHDYYPMAISSSNGQQASAQTQVSSDYSVDIVGDDSQMFTARIIHIIPIQSANTETINATIEITYSPTAAGSHQATIQLLNAGGIAVASKKLTGNATAQRGDIDGDGQVTVADVTLLINIILGNVTQPGHLNGDINDDGTIDISDVSALIDLILGRPIYKSCTYLILTMTDGSTSEYMLNEHSKVTIAKPYLIVKSGSGRPKSFSLEKLSQLRYEERMVSIDNNLAGVHISENDREILKAMKP